jgi:flagellar biosynthesis chaperone FliJ
LVTTVAAAWYLFFRPPDLSTFDAQIGRTVALADDIQVLLSGLQGPDDLPTFARAMQSSHKELEGIKKRAQGIEDTEHRSALVTVLDSENELLLELGRLAELPSAAIDESEFSLLPELVREFESAYKAAQSLRPVDGTPTSLHLRPENLERSLYDLAAYRRDVLAERARIRRQNQARAEQLASIEAFVGSLDGVIARYATARTELSDWIEETNAGRTWAEAYQVLDQQQARRIQLREELSALEAPAEFGETKTELLGIMDAAIDAMGAASRGMAEYQYDWSYWDFRDTPGWREFEKVTSDITNRLETTLYHYEATKEEVLSKLRTRKPLPALPD